MPTDCLQHRSIREASLSSHPHQRPSRNQVSRCRELSWQPRPAHVHFSQECWTVRSSGAWPPAPIHRQLGGSCVALLCDDQRCRNPKASVCPMCFTCATCCRTNAEQPNHGALLRHSASGSALSCRCCCHSPPPHFQHYFFRLIETMQRRDDVSWGCSSDSCMALSRQHMLASGGSVFLTANAKLLLHMC